MLLTVSCCVTAPKLVLTSVYVTDKYRTHNPIENRCSILKEDIWYGDCTTIGAGGTLKLFSKS